jgi:hypothetical protein
MVSLLILVNMSMRAASDFSRGRVPVSALLRSLFSGEIVVFHPGEMPLYKVERARVTEVPVGFPVSGSRGADKRRTSRELLFNLNDQIKPEPRQWVIVADPAGIALRNIDHLIPPDLPGPYGPPGADFLWARVHEGGSGPRDEAGPGLWAVRGEFLPLVLERWKEAWEAEPNAGVVGRTPDLDGRRAGTCRSAKRPSNVARCFAPPWERWIGGRCAPPPT